MSVLQHTHVSSSTNALSGEPAWLQFAEELSQSVPKAVDLIGAEKASELQKELRSNLKADSQWSVYSDSVFLEFKNGELVVFTDSQDATDLEYGTPEVPMNSKLRPFLRDATDRLAEHITQKLMQVYS